VVKRWLKYCQANVSLAPGKARYGNDEFTHFYYTQVMFTLGDKGFDALFPNARERVHWSKYREEMFKNLLQTQQEDGSWTSYSVGPVYATALYLIVLQMENEAVPILCSKGDVGQPKD